MTNLDQEKKRTMMTLKGQGRKDIYGNTVIPGDVVINLSYKRTSTFVVTKIDPYRVQGVQVRPMRNRSVRKTEISVSTQYASRFLLVREPFQSELPRIQEVIDEVRQSL